MTLVYQRGKHNAQEAAAAADEEEEERTEAPIEPWHEETSVDRILHETSSFIQDRHNTWMVFSCKSSMQNLLREVRLQNHCSEHL